MGAAWFTLKIPNLFPGERRRRFFDSDRKILRTPSMCPCEDFTHVLFSFVSSDCASAEIFREMWTTLAQFFSAQKKKKMGQASAWAWKTRVQNSRVYFSNAAWTFGFLCVKRSKMRHFLRYSVGPSLFVKFCLMSNKGRSDLRFYARKNLQACLGVRPTGSCKMRRNFSFRPRWQKA